ncbi:hypothetical protein SAMN04490203_3666 [Pseudomonas taetrolens]|uniref:Uncharacterized protein n=1 Tax=Pseudomonas taetrolens TaxID=47884 RepID=A0A1H4XEY9_PSETA|nr:hypothetical protein SAMN04490203_3666 [Pseudomonas taetrolens]SQF87704.1 Uncharacterised protein [Pseudomonas taetrolens]VEH50896.1 Uncharacterised protein [Pseudomonas taetrolens]
MIVLWKRVIPAFTGFVAAIRLCGIIGFNYALILL